MSARESTTVQKQLCPECVEKWLAWLGYRVIPPIIFVQIGTPTVGRILQAQETRFRERNELISHQQRLIERICAEQQHVPDDPT